MAEQRNLERRLAAVLAADVAGYSRLTGADEEGTVSRLRALRGELIDPAIARHRGRTVKTTGDGRLVEFASVVDAARCALDVQRVMAIRNEDFVPEKRIEFRIGIHLGDVLVEADGDLMGDGVNVAARLESIAEPGGICLSNAAYEQVRDKLKEEFVDLGEQTLKNIARPVRVYAVKTYSESPVLNAAASDKSGPPRLSIVVLPFANIGGDPEQEYFVDGVTESLTTDLSRIRGSFVIARNSAFSYKGKSPDVRQIGRELGVRYVLEGSVQRGGNRMRVNVQLIDAETGNHLWAERFDKPLADLFDMQDEIVARLANTLNAQLIAAEARRAEGAANPDSMDFCFRGWAVLNRGTSPSVLREAAELFDRALALDGNNVDALIGSGRALAGPVFAAMTDDRDGLRKAEERVRLALVLAPDHPLAHATLSAIYTRTNRIEDGVAESEQAIRLDPNLAFAHSTLASAKFFAGRPEDVEGHVEQAFRLSPRDPNGYLFHVLVGTARSLLGRHEDAVASFRRSIEAYKMFPLPYISLAGNLWLLGRQEEARRAVADGLALDPSITIRRLRNAMPAHIVRARGPYYDGLRQAGVPEG